MKNRFKMFKRGPVFYWENCLTGEQKSMYTRDEAEAQRLIQAKNEAVTLPQMNLAMAKTYLSAQDPKMITRTWKDVFARFCERSNSNTRMRHERVIRTKPMLFLKPKRLIETTADDLFAALKLGSKSTIAFLQTLHNDAVGMGWIPGPILARKLWPKMKKKGKRAITEAEHITLMAAVDDEWRLYFQLLWFIGASQTDAANLTDANINWQNRILKYERQKLNGRSLPPACLTIGKGLEEILKQLPKKGPLFPTIAKMDDRSRACFMWKLCKRVKIEGVSLHSYRYSWAERAKIAGLPQRWAQAALGHNSKAVHDAYARNALVVCPPVDEFMQMNAAIIEPATQQQTQAVTV
jgi:integrase